MLHEHHAHGQFLNHASDVLQQMKCKIRDTCALLVSFRLVVYAGNYIKEISAWQPRSSLCFYSARASQRALAFLEAFAALQVHAFLLAMARFVVV